MARALSFGRRWLSAALLLSPVGWGEELPHGTGRDETLKLCKQCHEVARSVSLRQDRAGWQNTINKMVALGMKGTEQELASVREYLAIHFPADDVPRLNVNTASAIELESALSLRRSQAAAVIAYREKNGKFKTLEELKKVPALDAAKIEAKKDRLVF